MAVPSAKLNRHARQRGVALITALLVVALATVTAVAMAARQQLDVRRTANLLDGDQAYAYALGVERWAGVILRRDAEENTSDTLGDAWAQRLSPIPVPGGQLDGFVVDLQGRFNLNNLLTADGQPSAPDMAYFQRLLRVLGLNEGLATAVLDWIDSDFDTRFPDGAEDDYYLLLERPYRAANWPLQSPSELRLIRGVESAVWDVLAPHVSALPGRTTLNINTASAPLLQALTEELTAQDAERLVEARGTVGYDGVDGFLQHELFAGREVATDGLGVASQYFLIRAEVTLGTARARLFSVAARQPTGLRILARTQGTW
ncbi:MAG: type II secretion system minor pseudopilin GspK [Gammaproteobacteria bacterium]